MRVLFVSAYRYFHDAVERWSGGCLDSLVARTDDERRAPRRRARRHAAIASSSVRYRTDARTRRRLRHELRLLEPRRSFRRSRCSNGQTGELEPVTDRRRRATTRGQRPRAACAAQRHRIVAPPAAIRPVVRRPAMGRPAERPRRAADCLRYAACRRAVDHEAHTLPALPAASLRLPERTASMPLRVVPHVDLPRFMGDWYVIASIPTFIETRRAQRRRVVPARRPTARSRRRSRSGRRLRRRAQALHAARLRRRPDVATPPWGMQFVWPVKARLPDRRTCARLHPDGDRPREARLRLDHGAHAAHRRTPITSASCGSWRSSATTSSKISQGPAALAVTADPRALRDAS